MTRGRSVAAVVAGGVASVVLSYGMDAVLRSAGAMDDVLPSTGSTVLVAGVLAYRTVFNAAGCWLAARLAPASPMRHALTLGFIGCLASVAGAAGGAEVGPGWYSWGLALLALPAAWIGGQVHEHLTPTQQADNAPVSPRRSDEDAHDANR
jgi:hypothetical protein